MSPSRTLAVGALAAAALAFLAADTAAQEGPAQRTRVRRLAQPQENLLPGYVPGNARTKQIQAGQRPAIMMTGYWPPSNEGVRRFSDDPVQNPLGWIGSNWEGRGYDVYAYFPEFTPPTCTSCGIGMGDLTVDYQDTSADFWPLADALDPIAVITYSRTNAQLSWEVEMNQYNRATWVGDYMSPTQPTPAPPDASVPAGHLRLSKLPVQEIVDDIDLANLGLNAFICFAGDGGGFLSEFMAYHGVWYQALHDDPQLPDWCIAAGHVHVGRSIPWETARDAVEVTLRSVIHYVDSVIDPACQDVDLYCPTTTNSVGEGAMLTTSGSTSIAANELRFLVHDATTNASGLLLYSAGQTTTPWGNGTRCITTPFQRLGPITQTDGEGFLNRGVDFTQPPLVAGPNTVLPGSTWYFQYAYRDVAAGGAQFNATNGAEITFCP